MFIPSLFGDPKSDTNTDVSTVGNTYETVTNVSGKGIFSLVTATASSLTHLVKCWIKITVDGGTALEIDCGASGVPNVTVTNGVADSGLALNFIIFYSTSLKVEAKNDTDTNAISVSTFYTLA
jgi:hypothetical protein